MIKTFCSSKIQKEEFNSNKALIGSNLFDLVGLSFIGTILKFQDGCPKDEYCSRRKRTIKLKIEVDQNLVACVGALIIMSVGSAFPKNERDRENEN